MDQHQYIYHLVEEFRGDETYIPFYDVPRRQESRVWIHEDDPTPTMKVLVATEYSASRSVPFAAEEPLYQLNEVACAIVLQYLETDIRQNGVNHKAVVLPAC
ncbi:unnamed protein product [Acanthoscelides obtectus]|uniref:Uncharacterized protein n=1 Tax=Acanthoscelides obtectus TaxID=200917 RepID=A0A9P0M000_ACAOB|nr:unnamed protein product [Acanthoscelides obtectus]CAK1672208.1 hypothetical protein AOBTE_LOCUS28715 [Acanthoscelides obtectus]